MSSKKSPAVGLSTITAIVAALAAGVPAIVALLDGIKTVHQAIVVAVALLVAGAVLVAMILSRGRQAVAMTVTPPRTGEGE